MANTAKTTLTEGPVGKTLAQLTWPIVFGLLGMVAFNLVDAFFVGQLGTKELAALSFTFPVVLVIHSLALGLGIGTSAVVSRAIGEGDQQKVKRTTGTELSPGVVAAVQTFGQKINLHPHLHFLVTEGGEDREGTFHHLASFQDSLLAQMFAREVFALLLREELISEALVEKIIGWRHTGFNVHSKVRGPRPEKRLREWANI